MDRRSTPNYRTWALTSAHQIGKKRLQLVGFAAMGAIFFVMACAQPSLRQGGGSSWLLLLYSLSFFFSDFGPNTTTFIIPALIFPTEGTARASPPTEPTQVITARTDTAVPVWLGRACADPCPALLCSRPSMPSSTSHLPRAVGGGRQAGCHPGRGHLPAHPALGLPTRPLPLGEASTPPQGGRSSALSNLRRHLCYRTPTSQHSSTLCSALTKNTSLPCSGPLQASPASQVNSGLIAVFSLCCVLAAAGFAWTWFLVEVRMTQDKTTGRITPCQYFRLLVQPPNCDRNMSYARLAGVQDHTHSSLLKADRSTSPRGAIKSAPGSPHFAAGCYVDQEAVEEEDIWSADPTEVEITPK